MTSQTLTTTSGAAVHRRDPRPQAAPDFGDPTSAPEPADSGGARDGSRDAATLVWDLTVHRLQRAFAQYLATQPGGFHEGQAPAPGSGSPDGPGLAGVRLAATLHAVNDIQDALRRMAAGSYGNCQRCGQPIAIEHLQAAPTIRWCPTCQADLGG